MKNCLIFGAGGHSGVVIEVLEESKEWKIEAIIGDQAADFLSLSAGYPIREENEQVIAECPRGIVAIGDNWRRLQVVTKILRVCPQFIFISAIHPSAIIANHATVGRGGVVAAGAIINSHTSIGEHCIVNSNATLEHNSSLGCFSSVAPAVTLGGGVTIGDYTAIGIGAIIQHNTTIGNHTIVGTGSVAVKSIADHCVAYGNPCKFIRNRKEGESYL